MKTNQVVVLQEVRDLKKLQEQDLAYQDQLKNMDKLNLLEEMVRFQEERTRAGKLSLQMIGQGLQLFKVLEERAETRELRELSRSYGKHLKLELESHVKAKYQATS